MTSQVLFDEFAVARDFGNAAKSYESAALMQMQILQDIAKTMNLYIDSSELVIDAGCGTGALSKLIKNPVVGVDISEAMCQEALKKTPCIVASIECFPVKSSEVFCVVSSLAFQWLNNPQKAFSEINSCLKTGGYFFLATLGANTLFELKNAFKQLGIKTSVSEFLTVAQLESLASSALFKVEKLEVKNVIQKHKNVFELMRHLKEIGANNKRADRAKGMLTPRALKKLELAYEAKQRSGIEANFEIIYMLLRKS